MNQDRISLVRSKVDSASKIVVLTGRGYEDSSWFRGQGGTKGNELLARIPTVATMENLMLHPGLVYEWVSLYRNLIKGMKPSPIQKGIALLQERKNATVITQAIDGMFYKAGCRKVIELYGNVMENKCTECGRIGYAEDDDSLDCPRCGSKFRPSIVLFGEMLNSEVMEKAFASCSNCDVLLVIGCSLDTSPTPELLKMAQNNGAFVACIHENPPAILRNSTVCLQGNSAEILGGLLRETANNQRKDPKRSPLTDKIGNIRIGQAQKYKNLEIFPLFSNGNGSAYYKLLDEAMKSGELVVDEIGESGTVPELRFTNKSAEKVLILEGEQIIGLKQNRIVNMTILIREKSELIVPVSCVEQGRWGRYDRRKRAYSDSVASSKLRAKMKMDLLKNIEATKRYTADQGRVWEQVNAYQKKERIISQTKAYYDYEKALRKELEQFKDHFKWQDNQVGLLARINGEFATLDIFDRPDVASKFKDRLIQSCSVDAYDQMDQSPSTKKKEEPQELLDQLASFQWKPFEAIGEGKQVRLGESNLTASALLYDNSVIHLSVFPTAN